MPREQADSEHAPFGDGMLEESVGPAVEVESSPKRVRVEVPWGRGDHVEIALHTLAELEGEGAPVIFDYGSMHRFDEALGLWSPLDEATVSRVIQSFAGVAIQGEKKPLRIRAGDVSGATRLAAHRVARPGFFAEAPRGLAFANGFVSVSAEGIGELRPHSPDNRARLGYAFAYERGPAPMRWLQFLDGVFRDDADKQEKILLVQEFFGASLVGIAPTFQRCFVALGDGENAKSKLGDIILAAMPAGSTCAIPPQAFEQEYRRAMLAGKRLNFVSELPEAEIIASESFKAIIDGSTITGRAIREAPFDFRPVAGHYYAANKLPGTNDQTHAFWRRFIVVTFNRCFEGDPARDPLVAEKIIAAELPAIVVWLLDGAARMLRQGEYTIPASHHEAIAKWRRGADQVALFLDERTTGSNEPRPSLEGPNDWTAASILYDEFVRWADRNRHRPMASNKFGTRMSDLKRAPHKTKRGAYYPVRILGSGEASESVSG
jgi:P4 family phage/plasmid primase-like protien